MGIAQKKGFLKYVFPKVYLPCQDIQGSLQDIPRQRWKEEEREQQQQPTFSDSVKLSTDNDINYTTVFIVCVWGYQYHTKGKEVIENSCCE